MPKERIYLDRTESSMTADGLPRVVPDGSPRYHFFLFKHTFEGDYQEGVGMSYKHRHASCQLHLTHNVSYTNITTGGFAPARPQC